ncbi:MAG: hypothetical protein LBQ22_09535 [Bacteroidales bacterium]|jgi:uncharacterized protein YneF (UPF0154 family)|nr:hypothetical protein [Bacteroidales bacterium]
MIFKVLIISIVIISLVVLGLGIGIFFSKKKSFPETSISKNPEMKKRNITCAKHDEYKACGLNGGCCGGANHGNND